MDSQLYIQAGFLLAFALYTGLPQFYRHADYLSPRGVIEIFKFLSFAKANLDDADLKRLKMDQFYQQDYPEKLPSEYKKMMLKYTEFSRHHLFTYEEVSEKIFERGSSNILQGFVIIFLILISFVIGPLMPLYTLSTMKEKNKNADWNMLVHPDQRSELLIFMISGICIIALQLIAWYVYNHFAISESLLFLSAGFATLMLLAGFTIQIRLQQKFSSRWHEVFDYIMQKAIAENNHDLYNAANNHYQSVSVYPSVPLTGTAKTFLAFNAGLQIILSYLFSK